MRFDPSVPAEFRDFRNLGRLIWHSAGWPQPDPRALEMMEASQHGPKRLVLMAPRGSTKSSVLVCDALGNFLHDRTLHVNHTSSTPNLSKQTADWAMKLIENLSVFRPLYPGPQGRWSSMEGFDVAGAPPTRDCSFTPSSLAGTSTGARADRLYIDDPENTENVLTAHKRGLLRSRIQERFSFLESDGSSVVRVAMTPHTEESIVKWFEERGFTILTWLARYPTSVYFQRVRYRLAPSIIKEVETKPELMLGGGRNGDMGQPANPSRYTEERLREIEIEEGRLRFELQYMLNTAITAETEFPLKISDLVVMDLNATHAPLNVFYGRSSSWDMPVVGFDGDRFYKPEGFDGWAPYEVKGLFVDPAGLGKDEMGCTVLAELNSQYFVLDNYGLGGFGSTIEESSYLSKARALARSAVRWKVNFVKLEDDFGDAMFTEILRPILLEEAARAGLTIGLFGEKAERRSKELRIISALEPIAAHHRLIVSREVVERDYKIRRQALNEGDAQTFMLMYQFSRITREPGCLVHDDRLESLAQGVKHFRELAGRNRAQQVSRVRETQLEAQMRKDLGYSPRRTQRDWNRAIR